MATSSASEIDSAVEYSLLLINIVSMQCVTQYSIVIRRISHEEELIQMSRITESKYSARLILKCDGGNVSKLSANYKKVLS